MNSYILAGGDSNSRQTYVVKIASAQTELIHLTAEKSTLTIKQVKDLWIPLSISPRLKRIVWIEEANLLTPPAQNALLKMLEEPPVDTTFYLTCTAATSLLPTIRSRCTIVIISEPSAVTNTTVLTELKRVMALTPGDRFANIVKRDRAESLSWIGEIESALSAHLQDRQITAKTAATLAKIARLAQNFHLQLASNCSVSLATQNFYLLLPHTRSIK